MDVLQTYITHQENGKKMNMIEREKNLVRIIEIILEFLFDLIVASQFYSTQYRHFKINLRCEKKKANENVYVSDDKY